MIHVFQFYGFETYINPDSQELGFIDLRCIVLNYRLESGCKLHVR